MSLSPKRQHHEQARKKHRHQQKQQAREAAKRERDAFPKWLLIGGIALMTAFVVGVAILG